MYGYERLVFDNTHDDETTRVESIESEMMDGYSYLGLNEGRGVSAGSREYVSRRSQVKHHYILALRLNDRWVVGQCQR